MAVQPDQKDFYTFVAGLNSEAGWFTAPPNTWKDGDNLEPNIDGILYRRKAVDYEANNTLYEVSGASSANDLAWAYSTSMWDAVNGDGDLNLIVAQVGRYVYFYEAIGGTVSGRKYSFSIDLGGNDSSGTAIKPTSNPSTIGTSTIKCTTAAGKLLIVSEDTNPLLVTYVDSTTITTAVVSLQFRDFVGVSDGFAVDAEPSAADPGGAGTAPWYKHEYNLRNQGWTTATLATYRAAGSSPSNAQSWIYGKDTNDDFQAALLKKQDFGTSPAAKGRFILNAFSRDRSTASGISATYVPTETENYRPKACAFFAGRAWYAGVKESTLLSNYVFFSQVATDTGKFGKCYQDQDPSSEVLNDIVDSDGGFVAIQDCGEVLELLATANGVVVFASNGVWKIAGTANSGFSATGYEVTKISSVGCVGHKTVVVTDAGVMYWSYNGIYSLEPTNSPSGVQIVNYSDTVVKKAYNNIPTLGKRYAEGVYDPANKLITWLYGDGLVNNAGTEGRYRKNKALVFDVRLKAFYTLSFANLSADSPYIVSPIVTKESGAVEQEYNVIASNGDTAIDGSSNQIIVNLTVPANGNSTLKLLTTRFVSSKLYVTFSDMLTTRDAPEKFYDWWSVDGVGVDVPAYVETTYVPGPTGFSKNMQALYVTTFMNRTDTDITVDGEPVNASGCLMRAKWEFSDSTASNKWSTQQQVYRIKRLFIDDGSIGFDNGFPLVVAKSKVRGRGKVLQLKFESEDGKDMQLAGWSIVQLGNTV